MWVSWPTSWAPTDSAEHSAQHERGAQTCQDERQPGGAHAAADAGAHFHRMCRPGRQDHHQVAHGNAAQQRNC